MPADPECCPVGCELDAPEIRGKKDCRNKVPREIVPAEIIVPAMPVLDPEWVTQRLRGGSGGVDPRFVSLRGINTAPTSVADAERLARSVVRELEQAIRDGDRTTIAKMLRDRPELILVPSVREILLRWIASGSLRPPRGRPRGATSWSPIVVAALVDDLISRGVSRNREQAFALLGALGLSYESAKRLCDQATREPRFRALLLLDEQKARSLEERDLRWMDGAERLSPDSTVSRSADDPLLGGIVDMQFRAIK